MSSKWVPWSERYLDFAPVVALHPYEPYYPTSVDSFLREKDCELWVLSSTESDGPEYGIVNDFAEASYFKRCQWLMHSDFKKRYPSLRLHHNKIDMRASIKLQNKYPKMVYVDY